MKSVFSVLSGVNTRMVLVISIVLNLYVSYLSTRVSNDALRQIATANNFLNGNGFSVLTLDTAANVVAHKETSWPYGYRFIAVPVLYITNRSAEATFLVILFLGQALLLISVYKFIALFPVEYRSATSNLALIFLGICTAPMKYFGDIDFITLALYLFALYCCARFFSGGSKKIYFAVFILLVSLLPLFRYAYVVQSVSLLALFLLLDFFDNRLKHKVKYLFFLLPLISLMGIVGSSYFVRNANRLALAPELLIRTKSYIVHYYAPFFNSFFPDYILVSFLKKNEEVYVNYVMFLLIAFTLISIIIFAAIVYNYRQSLKLAERENKFFILPENLLVWTLGINLLFIVGLYRTKTYFMDDISSGLFAYKGLAVVSRYLASFHISVLILAIYYLFKLRSRFFFALVFTAFIFGLLQWGYLRTRFSIYDRAENLYVMNEPKGSHEEMLKLYSLLKDQKHVYYFYNAQQDSLYYRQVYPRFFASTAGAVLCNGDTSLIKKVLNKADNPTIVVQETKEYDTAKYEGFDYSEYDNYSNYTFLRIKRVRNAQQ